MREPKKRYAILTSLRVVEVLKVTPKRINTEEGVYPFSRVAILDPTEHQIMTANVTRMRHYQETRELTQQIATLTRRHTEEARELIAEWQSD